MKVYNSTTDYKLSNELNLLLENIRSKRQFDVEKYVDKKINKINQYMKKYGLKSCLIAVSGGVDSAITLGLIKKSSEQKDSPIEKIVALTLPVFNSGATNQDLASSRAAEVCSVFDVDVIEIDLTSSQNKLREHVDKSLGIKGDNWASGQLVAYLRTPTLYYTTSLLTQEGLSPILCGTTNRDEGAYLGYFGKASDGLVDVQVISDLHKNEVYQVGDYLQIPSSIIDVTPAGDMYDGRMDEEVFGASYDFVEIYLNFLNYSEEEQNKLLESLSDDAKEEFKLFQSNLENLHQYNKHKYLGHSPAVHFDVIEGKVNKGWIYYNHEG